MKQFNCLALLLFWNLSIFSFDLENSLCDEIKDVLLIFKDENLSIIQTIYENIYYLNYKFSLQLHNTEIGYLNCEPNDDSTIYISLFEIDLPYRKHGYGEFLLDFVCRKFISEGIEEIYLYANPFNLQANQSTEDMLPKLIKFYNKNGFFSLNEKDNTSLFHTELLHKKIKRLIKGIASEIQTEEIEKELLEKKELNKNNNKIFLKSNL